jgi:hypothetical protein
MEHHRHRFVARLDMVEQVAGRYALPVIVVTRPAGDAVDVAGKPRLRQRHERGPVERRGSLDHAADLQPPALLRDIGLAAQIEHRPVAYEMLAGRKPFLLGPRDMAGQELTFARPALLRASELAVVGKFGIIHAALLRLSPPPRNHPKG